MIQSVVPALIDRILEVASELLPDHLVVDGFPLTLSVGDYLMVGMEDASRPQGASTAATSQQTWANANHTTRDESGDITCAAFSYSGLTDPKPVREAAYATLAAVAEALRADPSLGLEGVLWTSVGTDIRYLAFQSEEGCDATVVFSIAFRARI